MRNNQILMYGTTLTTIKEVHLIYSQHFKRRWAVPSLSINAVLLGIFLTCLSLNVDRTGVPFGFWMTSHPCINSTTKWQNRMCFCLNLETHIERVVQAFRAPVFPSARIHQMEPLSTIISLKNQRMRLNSTFLTSKES